MTSRIWPPDEGCPPADQDQRRVAQLFREHGSVMVEAPPGAGKTFVGVYLALCAYRLGWASERQPVLMLTFSRNARVQIEQEVSNFRERSWMSGNEQSAIKVSNYHAFYLELVRKRAGVWGCAEYPRPAAIVERTLRVESLLERCGLSRPRLRRAARQAALSFALKRFPLDELMAPGSEILLGDDVLDQVYNEAASALRSGRPHYDDFAPLVLNLLEHSPELRVWCRTAHPTVVLDEFHDTDCVQWQILKLLRPRRLVLLLDRYQMIYEWRGARSSRIEIAGGDLGVPPAAHAELTQLHRAQDRTSLAEFLQELRLDELKGAGLAPAATREWLTLRPTPKIGELPDIARSLQAIRTRVTINTRESTAILTRANYLAEYLHRNLRMRSGKGRSYVCRWIGADNNPDELVRDHVWRLRQVSTGLELRCWIGQLVDSLVPDSVTKRLRFSCGEEFSCKGADLLKRRTRHNVVSVREQLTSWWSEVEPDNQEFFGRAMQVIPTVARTLVEDQAFLDPDALYYVRELARAVFNYRSEEGGNDWEGLCDHLEDSVVRSTYLRLRSRPRGVHILTVHQGKGREFDHVIIPWLAGQGEPQQAPSGAVHRVKYRYDNFADRRLLYVALSRAKREVTIVYPQEDPSIFLGEWHLLGR